MSLQEQIVEPIAGAVSPPAAEAVSPPSAEAVTEAAADPAALQIAEQIVEQIHRGRLAGRLWLYSNYHCNLSCTYCLTESSPSVPQRILEKEKMVSLARQGLALGFTSVGITGGEPFMLPWIVDAVEEISAFLPVIVLTNGTLFTERRLKELERLANREVRLQISLDRPDPESNDAMRGPENFQKVTEAVPALIRRGIRVRIATTLEDQTEEEAARLRELVRSLGVADEDHVVRTIVRRGRAALQGLGVQAPLEQMPPELTITSNGAFWTPFAPTFKNGRLETDLLLTKVVDPLTVPSRTLLDLLSAAPETGVEVPSGFV